MASIRDSIDPSTTTNLENVMNATARTIRKSNAATTKAALAAAAAEAVATVTEKVAPKPRARKKATTVTEISPENAVRLAAAAKAVAEKLIMIVGTTDDPKRAKLAEVKATAACTVANLRAEEAKLPIPFPFGIDEPEPTVDVEPEPKVVRKPTPRTPRKPRILTTIPKVALKVEPEPEIDADAAETMLDAYGVLKVKLSAPQKALMMAIGRREFSFFDEGIEADSGIWHQNLTDEASKEVAATPKGVSNVIGALGRKGLLDLNDQGEDGVWVTLTESGAALARILATSPKVEEPAKAKATTTAKPKSTPKATKAATPTPAPVKPVAEPKVKVESKAKVAKAAKEAAVTNPALHPKVVALAAYAVEQGWVSSEAVDGPSVVVTARREDERLSCTFIDGKLDLANMPRYFRADGSVVLLRNVSAVKKQMDSDPAARPVKAARSTARRSTAKADGAEDAPQKSLPFDPAETSDEEIAEIVAGSVIRWRRTDGAIETAIAGKKVGVKVHPRKPGKAHRVVSFFEMVESDKHGAVAAGERFVGLDAMLTVGTV